MSVVRCTVAVNGELQHDETSPLAARTVQRVAYPGLHVLGQQIEVAFEFDPPLLRPDALSDPAAA